MKKILLSVTMLLFACGALALGSTGAFFSDTELSIGNTFSAGAIDLKIDNTSYYNGVATSTTSWTLADLTIEKFFNFFDLKPGDYGEDTISLHVDTNDAYLCANITLTSNDDNTCNEPELGDEPSCTAPGVGQGELAQNVNFMWWADDGDNVLETGEEVISTGPIGALTLNTPYPITLADSDQNIWTGIGGPVAALDTKYIGKAWCFGSIGQTPVTQDGSGNLMTPAGNNNGNGISGEPEDGGYSCNGSALNNDTQTDSLTADVSFSAVQSRNNSSFQCDEPEQPPVACELIQNGFFSLGFPSANPFNAAEIVLSFNDNFVVDGPGVDLKLWEVTGGTSYPDERVNVYIGDTLVGPWTQVGDDVTRDAEIDIDILAPAVNQARYVRIVDASNLALFEATADGYDLDAVQALNCIQRED